MTEQTLPEIERKQRALEEMCTTLRERKYANVEYLRSGGTRDLFLVKWGPSKQRVVVAKVDRVPENVVAQFNVSRGYTTANELDLASKITHEGVTRIYDYFTEEESARFGLSGAVSFEEYIPGSRTLEEIISTNGPLSEPKFKEVILQTTEIVENVNSGVGVADGKGILHRDIKPSNILVYEENGQTKVKVIDWANAGEAGTQERSVHPTAGGRSFSNPLLYGVFTGQEGIYDKISEAHSLAATADYAIRGRPRLFIDPFSRKATIWDTGETLLNEDGSLNKEKYEQELYRIRKSYAFRFRKYAEAIRCGLTSNKAEKFSSVFSFLTNMKYQANQPRLFSSLKKWGIAATAAALVGGATIGGFILTSRKASLEQKLYEQEIRSATREHVKNVRNYLQYEDTTDRLAIWRLEAWLNKFAPWDYNKQKRVGDLKTSIACYIENIWDRRCDVGQVNKDFPGNLRSPVTVFTAIKMANGKTDWQTIGPIIEKLNLELHCAVEEATANYTDAWARTAGDHERYLRDENWRLAEEVYNGREKMKREMEKKKSKPAVRGSYGNGPYSIGDGFSDQQRGDELKVEMYKKLIK